MFYNNLISIIVFFLMQNSLKNTDQQSFYSINNLNETKLDFSNYPVYETLNIKPKLPPISPHSQLKKLQNSKIKQTQYNLDEFKPKQQTQMASSQIRNQNQILDKNQPLLDQFKSIQYEEYQMLNMMDQSQQNKNQGQSLQQNKNQGQCLQQNKNQGQSLEQNKNYRQSLQQNKNQGQSLQKQEKSVQISFIKSLHDKSECFDQQMFQLTKQLQRIQDQNQIQSHQSMQSNNFHLKNIQIQKNCQKLTQKIKKLKQDQLIMQKQMLTFCQIIKKTQKNNDYLQKQLQYFTNKIKKQSIHQLYQNQNKTQKEKNFVKNKQKAYDEYQFKNQIQNRLNFVSITKIQNPSQIKLDLTKQYDKKYQITPTKFNKSSENLIYKKFSLIQKFQALQQLKHKQNHWIQLHKDQTNEYKIIASYHDGCIVVKLIQPQSKTQVVNNTQTRVVKKNYEYFIDLSSPSTDIQSKINSLEKEIVINTDAKPYIKKQFIKKISLYIMITQQKQSYVDFVKYITLPNPINFYFQKRFNHINIGKFNNIQNIQNIPQKIKKIQQQLNNLIKLMFLYRIQIKKQADVNIIDKLRQLWWINNEEEQSQNNNITKNIKYFSIKGSQNIYYIGFKNLMRSIKDNRQIDGQEEYGIAFTLGYVKSQNIKKDKFNKQNQDQRDKKLVNTQIFSDIIEYLCFMTVL